MRPKVNGILILYQKPNEFIEYKKLQLKRN